MFLLRIKYFIYSALMLLVLSSCATVGGGDSASSSGATPKSDDAWSKVPAPYVDGLKAAQKGKSKQAIKLFQQSIQQFPEFGPAYTNMGLQQLRLKDRDSARKTLEKAIDLSPNSAVAYNHLGVIARLDGDFATAKKMYMKALVLDADYAIAHLNMGILLDLYLYDLEPALQHYEKYQSIIDKKDTTVAKWIIDLKRRISKQKKS